VAFGLICGPANVTRRLGYASGCKRIPARPFLMLIDRGKVSYLKARFLVSPANPSPVTMNVAQKNGCRNRWGAVCRNEI
jgi:hypothetical protein